MAFRRRQPPAQAAAAAAAAPAGARRTPAEELLARGLDAGFVQELDRHYRLDQVVVFLDTAGQIEQLASDIGWSGAIYAARQSSAGVRAAEAAPSGGLTRLVGGMNLIADAVGSLIAARQGAGNAQAAPARPAAQAAASPPAAPAAGGGWLGGLLGGRGAAAPAPAAPTAAQRRRGKATLDELVADGGLAGVTILIVFANGFFTVSGVMSLFPSGLVWQGVGLTLGLIAHFIISRIELAYITWRRILSPYLVPLLIALGVDVGTSVQGFLSRAAQWFPSAFGTLPTAVWEWTPLFAAIWARLAGLVREQAGEPVMWATMPAYPAWVGQAVLVTLVMGAIAIFSERLARRTVGRFRTTWTWYNS